MRHFLFTLLAVMTVLSAAAQEPDTTSTVVGEKLDFDAPQVISENYFESVRAHLSKEGRKAWKPEFSVRGNMQIFIGSFDVTAGIRTSPNKVFGIYAGRASVYHDAYPASSYRVQLGLHHRHYLPLDRKRRFSLYSDLFVGGSYLYRVSGVQREPSFPGDRPALLPETGTIGWWCSWQSGLSIRFGEKANLFFGPSVGPAIGVHAGIAL